MTKINAISNNVTPAPTNAKKYILTLEDGSETEVSKKVFEKYKSASGRPKEYLMYFTKKYTLMQIAKINDALKNVDIAPILNSNDIIRHHCELASIVAKIQVEHLAHLDGAHKYSFTPKETAKADKTPLDNAPYMQQIRETVNTAFCNGKTEKQIYDALVKQDVLESVLKEVLPNMFKPSVENKLTAPTFEDLFD